VPRLAGLGRRGHTDTPPRVRWKSVAPLAAQDAASSAAGCPRASPRLANSDIDTALVLDENLASTGSLSVEHLSSEPLVVVAAPQPPLAQAPAIGPADLDGVPVLLTDKGCGYRRLFERALDSAGARPAAGEFTSGETVKRCVEASTMIGVLAHISVTAELNTGRLIVLPWNGPPLTLSSYLVAHQQRSISPARAALRATTR
jgi:DNA-binding transcriptional LysR family regulator